MYKIDNSMYKTLASLIPIAPGKSLSIALQHVDNSITNKKAAKQAQKKISKTKNVNKIWKYEEVHNHKSLLVVFVIGTL